MCSRVSVSHCPFVVVSTATVRVVAVLGTRAASSFIRQSDPGMYLG